jgi:hypothetical protein
MGLEVDNGFLYVPSNLKLCDFDNVYVGIWQSAGNVNTYRAEHLKSW